jgi:hypothetical protein
MKFLEAIRKKEGDTCGIDDFNISFSLYCESSVSHPNDSVGTFFIRFEIY